MIMTELPELTVLDEAELLARWDASPFLRKRWGMMTELRLHIRRMYAGTVSGAPGAGFETDPDEQAFWSYAEGRAAEEAPPPIGQPFVV